MNTDLSSLLNTLNLAPKEVQLYLLMLEIGMHPAATFAKHLKIPKSTVLFLCNRLATQGIVRRSQRGRTQFYYAMPEDLQSVTQRKLKEQEFALSSALPLLHGLKNPFSAKPATTFYDGIDGCRKSYWSLLESTTEILEFGIHKDLVEKLGRRFMQDFILERARRKIFLRSISNENDVDRTLQRRDRKEWRAQRFFSADLGRTYSSIAIYERKVLLLNLHASAFGILIENREVSETMRTIFTVMWEKLA